MMGSSRQLLAVLEPGSVQVAEFDAESSAVRLLGSTIDESGSVDLAVAAEQLATLVEAHGGRGASVAVVLRGFGSVHHLLQLPPASEDVWQPIVERELRTREPELSDPAIAFVPAGTGTRGQHPVRDLLVVAMPRAAIEQLRQVLGARRIRLDFLTLVPVAAHTASRELNLSGQASVLILSLPRGPVVAMFHDGEPQLVLEPPLLAGASSAMVARDAIERGVLHLRQRHRGVRPEQYVFAGSDEEERALQHELRTASGGVELPGWRSAGDAAEFLATGALVASARGTANLLGTRPRAQGTLRRTARLAMAGALVTAALWALAGWAVAWRNAGVRGENEAAVRERADELAPWLSSLQERRSHDGRLAFTAALDGEYLRLERTLRAIGVGVPRAVRLDSLRLDRAGGGWQFRLAGASLSGDLASAISTLQQLSAGLNAQVGVAGAVLEEFDYLTVDEAIALGADAGVRFKLSGSIPTGVQ